MDAESRFIDKVVSRLNQRFNKEKWPKKEMDLFQSVLDLSTKYVRDEILKYGVDFKSDLYYKIMRRWIRDNYGNGKLALPGDRIRLIKMSNDPDPIEPNTTVTVKKETTAYMLGEDHVYVDWYNGRRLSLLVGTDEFEVIEPDNTYLYTY